MLTTKPDLDLLGRRFRRVIGIDEALLAQVPEERPRYTRLGVIVCCTATISALSTSVITTRLPFGGLTWLVTVLVMVVWGGFILTIDSWLIASMHGALKAKARQFLPRLLVAALLGFVIAEPLVLSVFQAEIDQRVAEDREHELAAFVSRWRTCNPPDDEAAVPADCADHRLNLADSPGTVRAQLADLGRKRDTQSAELGRDMGTWEQLDTVAKAECAGVAGPGTTGVPGEGPECTRDRQMADQYRRDTRLEQRRADVAALDTRLTDLRNQLTTAEAGYGRQVTSAIERKVADWRASHGGIGVLERIDALARISAGNVAVTVAQWVFRLLLVLIDCLPVLTKWVSGATAYDRMVRRQIDSRVRRHEDRVRHDELVDAAVRGARTAELTREPRARLAEEAEENRRAELDRERRREAEIDRLTELYRESPG
ncbi:MAG TPA: DUF4407 domain-containing protein [Amycolatopsis sp.]|uniref:DUF4407 domain-containing protein n=1 Tax=Amycolatopsis nalaikhensis TaxID=715472 RepID=A0ABY8XZN1_9PSEU|nr:DUF4407 domain-containing protein [Amycolatopsis sp. 2-2]WIV61189.1 DUF4407 domain-containing protein [Amycolatopsis sp. 2-2]HWD03375.1 DUF4407 domain-containing protein [Amycolatopsis sp.]